MKALASLLGQDLATEDPAARELETDALFTPGTRDRLKAVVDRRRSLGLDRGHAGLLSAADDWLTRWGTT
jgi:hypothetical protein